MKTIGSLSLSLLLTAAAFTCSTAPAASTSELLQQGLYAEEVEGNINAAIKTYEQVIRTHSAPPNLVAQALYRQGMCYLKLKDEASARAVLERLVTAYPGQTEIVEKARPVLDDLTNFDPALLMPPNTLVYVEFGNPGRQIETTLNMLKGTPFENPLAAIGGQQAANPGEKSPGDIMNALLNPSMMAEFKKVRSSAIGITGMSNNQPLMISVLYPGKSDALRGLILAGIGVAGTPGESIEGMQTVTLPEDMAVAYDDKVVISARPASQLQWCVKQYKGLTSEPTLASGNPSFQQLGKAQRLQNAVTIWANVDEAYAQVLKMIPPGQVPPGIVSANALLDFNNIDQLLLTESIETNFLNWRTEVQFKDGHRCLAYDLIRTPNISKAALEAVPADAVALASFALGQADAAQADKIRASIQNVTGLDVGREIFANLEQVTIFALPAKTEASGGQAPEFLPGRLGLALTSRNPEQTRQILDTLLGTFSRGQNDAGPGRYKLGSGPGQNLYCYLEQVGRTTLLSLNREVIDASTAAFKNHQSVCTSGSLRGAVSRLAPSASKLLLVNAGGTLRMLGPQMHFGELTDEQAKQVNAHLDQIARAAGSTTIELRSDEQLNNLTVSAVVTGIPPLNQVLGPAMQIAHITDQARAEAMARRLREQIPATIAPAAQAPVIDGEVDDVWNSARPLNLSHVIYEPPTSPKDLSAEYKALWDANNLYLLVTVTDDQLRHDAGPDTWWETDGVEVYIDATNGKSAEYGPTDYQYAFVWDKNRPQLVEAKHNRTNGVQYAVLTTDTGYRVEIRFPWSTLGTKPAVGAKLGLDVEVNDSDTGAKRDSKLAWHAREDNAWVNPQAFGNAELAGLVGWWKFDEAEGAVAADSSGNSNNGSLQGHPVWRPRGGKFGGAIELNGNGDYVKIDNEAPFNITGQITISAWVNIKSVPQEWTGIVTKGDTAWRLSTERAQNAFHFGLTQLDYLNGQTQVDAGQWHHVVCVYDGQTMKIYVDGRLDSSSSRTGPIGTNDIPVCIGENLERAGRCWNGLIDDVRVYNYALSGSQIQALANAQ
jgi:hypothetical protein